jgi:hypothetical protein
MYDFYEDDDHFIEIRVSEYNKTFTRGLLLGALGMLGLVTFIWSILPQ